MLDLGQTEVLIDGGDTSAGASLVSYLGKVVDGDIEAVVATHPHADHIGGLIDVLRAFQVDKVYWNGEAATSKTYGDFMALARAEPQASLEQLKRGDTINVGSLAFAVLNPPGTMFKDTNNDSILLRLKYGDVSFLFTGDAGNDAEASMLAAGLNVGANVLKVGHHGSKYSSSVPFLKAVLPQTAVYMAGANNSYGHPHAETIAALNQIGAKVYGTDIHGTVVVATDGQGYELKLENPGPPRAPPVIPPVPTLTPTPSPTPAPTPTVTPTPTLTPSEMPGEPSESTEQFTRNYSWTYKGKWSWQGTIPKSLYDYYQALPRPPTKNYSVYVTHPLDDSYMDLLVEKIREASAQEGFSEYETVALAAAFVQSLPYSDDSVTTPYDEYPRYPVETLVDNGGDCEDTSILLASLIDKLGYGVVLIVLPHHCAVGVKSGDNMYGTYWEYQGSRYYYIETTGAGWDIGALPEEYQNTAAEIYPMVPVPIITHDWTIEAEGNIAKVTVKVANLGTTAAQNVTVFGGFDAGGDQCWNGELSDPFQVEANHEVTIVLRLRVPLGKHTRLVVQIGIDNHLVDESRSKWFDT